MKNWKDHKGKMLVGSVAAVAIAPVLTSQSHQSLETPSEFFQKPLSDSVQSQVNPYSQNVMMLQTHHHITNKKVNGTELKQSSNLNERESVDLTKDVPPLRLVEEKSEESLLASETVGSVWPEDTILMIGDESTKVETVQTYLKELGYYVGDLDGIYGAKTKEAVKHYQRENGLSIDGVVGTDMVSHLIGTKHIVSDTTQPDHFNEIYQPEQLSHSVYISQQSSLEKSKKDKEKRSYFQKGDKHNNIKVLQDKLQKAGYYHGPKDGIYGYGTEQAVILLQQDQGLSIDGLAGKEVFDFLKSSNLTEIAESRARALAAAEESATTTSSQNDESETTSSKEPAGKSDSFVENIIAKGEQLIGTPYVWGGTSPSGFDCSGFLVYLYNQSGKDLPRSVSDIWNVTSSVSKPQRGDFVFFETYKKGPSHAGIYLGDGAFIHTGTSSGVTISYLHESYWDNRYLGARRH
ncbi:MULTISPECIES: peptidoglycan-binding protein [Bacillaceae]|uniref:Peptidoglycan-binding protein n=1 Tax=Evansella alkalicola TaxID=745819 RepID=A0ABS6JSL1_9BACI|nr:MULTISPECIES: peptidoglycan-binding protein [Bacillaceae]MBU9721405.1 peptidoglycan-binding protein [Bacillus alkalicola]